MEGTATGVGGVASENGEQCPESTLNNFVFITLLPFYSHSLNARVSEIIVLFTVIFSRSTATTLALRTRRARLRRRNKKRSSMNSNSRPGGSPAAIFISRSIYFATASRIRYPVRSYEIVRNEIRLNDNNHRPRPDAVDRSRAREGKNEREKNRDRGQKGKNRTKAKTPCLLR